MATLQTCTVSFAGSSGVRHIAEVSAETLFEAAVLGVKAISQQWGEEPGVGTRIEVQVKSPAVRHEVTLAGIRQWLGGTSRSPKEALLRERLRSLL